MKKHDKRMLLEITFILLFLFLAVTFLNACGIDRYAGNKVRPKDKYCTVAQEQDLTVISCPDGTKTAFFDGNAMVTPSPLIEIVDPCGDDEGRMDEVLLVFDDGTILAWLKRTGLIVLTPGNYVTTDKQLCFFEITTDGEILY